ncbi:hypothetical protein B9Z19DRAFT_432325 [Tuber borchii]|uniref:Uncharacterized protein n=1 Tax=Tuber borchii TaxID=42251 RepID=A0A2T6ZGF3_TUBBO|nr:hypothetical protein B9Z19DRAFT_432325 [Tuber borchii]
MPHPLEQFVKSAFDPINKLCDSMLFSFLWHLHLRLSLVPFSEGIPLEKINSIRAVASQGSGTAANRNRRRGTYERRNKEKGKNVATVGLGQLRGSGLVFPDGERCWYKDFSAADRAVAKHFEVSEVWYGWIPCWGFLNLERVIKIAGKSDNDADDNVVDTMWREMSLCWENRAIA